MPRTVHCLINGMAVCGQTRGSPSTWPAHHAWISEVNWPHTREASEELAQRGGMVCMACDLKVRDSMKAAGVERGR